MRPRNTVAFHGHGLALLRRDAGGVSESIRYDGALGDLDRLEALGAIGIARCFAVSGALGRSLFDQNDPFAHGRAADDSRFALDHFAVKLLRLPETFLTATGKRLAEGRAAAMRRASGAGPSVFSGLPGETSHHTRSSPKPRNA